MTNQSHSERETIVVLDFGGQYKQLIARRVRECHVYCEIHSYQTGLETLKAMNPKGIILTGGPNSPVLSRVECESYCNMESSTPTRKRGEALVLRGSCCAD